MKDMNSNANSIITSSLQSRPSTAFLRIATDELISITINNPKTLFYSELSLPLLSQLGTVSDNLVNCV